MTLSLLFRHHVFSAAVLVVFCEYNAFADNSDNKTSCDGFQKIAVETPDGFCLAAIADGFKFPRSVLPMSDGTILVADMGGWVENRGSIWQLSPKGGTFTKKKILENLDRPAYVTIGPDGWIYSATPSTIFKLKIENPTKSRVTVISDLPADGLHPLTVFTFDSVGNLFVNVGSASDSCRADAGKNICNEEAAGRGTIRKYQKNADGSYSAGTVFAKGLRNSMAMEFVDKVFYVAENSRDSIQKADPRLSDADLPHDEINAVTEGGHFGWPYCYDLAVNSPEFPKYSCARTIKPVVLVPAHAAPLGMLHYKGDTPIQNWGPIFTKSSQFPEEYRNALIVAYHGYRANGHRIVVMPFSNSKLQPSFDLVRRWTKSEAVAQGAPVGLGYAPDGSILIADDKNKRILRLSFDPSKGKGTPLTTLVQLSETLTKKSSESGNNCTNRPGGAIRDKNELTNRVQQEVFMNACFECHGKGDVNAGRLKFDPCDAAANVKMLLAPGPDGVPLVVPKKLTGPLYLRVRGDRPGYPQMPPGGMAKDKILLLERWIESLDRVPQSPR